MNSNVIANNSILQNINASDPIYQLNEQEFDEALLYFGSFISIINNKRINQTMLLVTLLENEKHRQCFKLISGIDENQTLLYNLIIRFPVLCKSKIIKCKIKELTNDRKRKINL